MTISKNKFNNSNNIVNANETRLYILRKEKNLTQLELAKIIGVTRRNYGYYETGYTPLPLDISNKLADFYETSTDYILYRTDERKPYPKKVKSEVTK